MQQLHDVSSTANILGGISPWTIRAYIRQGKLRPVRIGRRVLLEESEIARFVAEAKANGESGNHKESEVKGQ